MPGAKLEEKISNLATRIANEFRLVRQEAEEAWRNFTRRVSSSLDTLPINVWSVDAQKCYVNTDWAVSCSQVDVTNDHVKFKFMDGVWRGQFDIRLDNLVANPNHLIKTLTDYTVSFELQIPNGGAQYIDIGSVWVMFDEGNPIIAQNLTSVTLEEGWTRFTFSFNSGEITNFVTAFGLYITRADASNGNLELHLRKLQLQEGLFGTTFKKNFDRMAISEEFIYKQITNYFSANHEVVFPSNGYKVAFTYQGYQQSWDYSTIRKLLPGQNIVVNEYIAFTYDAQKDAINVHQIGIHRSTTNNLIEVRLLHNDEEVNTGELTYGNLIYGGINPAPFYLQNFKNADLIIEGYDLEENPDPNMGM